MIIWLSGQSGSGKTTLAKALQKMLVTKEFIRIDGDILRKYTLNFNYTKRGRLRNVRNAYYISSFLNFLGFNVIVSLVSPYVKYRDAITKQKNSHLFILQTLNRDLRKEYHTKFFQLPKTEYTIIDTDKPVFKSLLDILKVLPH